MWEQVRVKGRDRFILREGLLRRGVPFGVLFALVQAARVLFFDLSLDSFITIAAAWGFATVSFGAGMGLWYWQEYQQDYQKPTENHHVVSQESSSYKE